MYKAVIFTMSLKEYALRRREIEELVHSLRRVFLDADLFADNGLDYDAMFEDIIQPDLQRGKARIIYAIANMDDITADVDDLIWGLVEEIENKIDVFLKDQLASFQEQEV